MVSIPACIFWLVLIFPVQVYEAPLHALDLLQLYLQLLCTAKKNTDSEAHWEIGGSESWQENPETCRHTGEYK